MLLNGFTEAKQLLEHQASVHVWLDVMKLLVVNLQVQFFLLPVTGYSPN